VSSRYYLADGIGDNDILQPSVDHVQEITETLSDTDAVLVSACSMAVTEKLFVIVLRKYLLANRN